MLGMKTYDAGYIQSCRDAVGRNLELYDLQVGASPAPGFEASFFNAQVMLLEYMFVHRLSGIEGKAGNALNEVRVLCNSLLYNKGKLQIERLPGWPNSAVSGLKLPAARSILGLTNGQSVELTREQFRRLSDAFFAELEKRYL